jgi:hypothetical protein
MITFGINILVDMGAKNFTIYADLKIGKFTSFVASSDKKLWTI